MKGGLEVGVKCNPPNSENFRGSIDISKGWDTWRHWIDDPLFTLPFSQSGKIRAWSPKLLLVLNPDTTLLVVIKTHFKPVTISVLSGQWFMTWSSHSFPSFVMKLVQELRKTWWFYANIIQPTKISSRSSEKGSFQWNRKSFATRWKIHIRGDSAYLALNLEKINSYCLRLTYSVRPRSCERGCVGWSITRSLKLQNLKVFTKRASPILCSIY